MDFALFYEIPVAPPWHDGDEYTAIHNYVEAVVLADKLGFHSVWNTEHHFLKELSISTAPEVLFGHIAARTENIKLGHGVRLLPHPYNNPIRAAEQAAMVDILSKGRLLFGVGRSATRVELEGFGINPHETRQMQAEALQTILRAWTEDEVEFDGKYWKQPRRRVVPKPIQRPHPPVWWATTSDEGHISVGEMGLNLLSFTVGVEVDVLSGRIAGYREGLARAKPITQVVEGRVGVFTLVHCGRTNEEARQDAAGSFEWYVQSNGKFVNDLAEWLVELGQPAGTYQYIKDRSDAMQQGRAEEVVVGAGLSYDQLVDMGAVVAGGPDQCVELAKKYEEAGCDLLLCLVQPHRIPHEKLMQSIELIGREVIPAFKQ